MRVGIVSASLGRITVDASAPTGPALASAAGHNTGNLAFRYAVSEHVASEKIHVPWDADPAWVRERCDVLVIPSSNQAHPTMDFSRRADFIETVGLPCLPVGLGAQAPELGARLTFLPGTLRYLQALAERSHLIGVRGEYTAEVLAGIGVRNTVVIGCPANFINPLPTLGRVIEEKLFGRAVRRLAVTAGDLDPHQRSLERKLYGWVLAHDGAYVCQSRHDLVALARRRRCEVAEEQLGEIYNYFESDVDDGEGRARFLAEAEQRFRVFFDAEAWLSFLAHFDLVIGTRFHGNLLALQAGTPGVCIHHDARTEELCDTLAIPHIGQSDLMAARDLGEVPSRVSFDGAAYDRRRASLARAYRQLLAAKGVAVSRGLAALAAAEAGGGSQEELVTANRSAA